MNYELFPFQREIVKYALEREEPDDVPPLRALVKTAQQQAHLFERPDPDRADEPDDDRWAERNERWFGWGEKWNAE